MGLDGVFGKSDGARERSDFFLVVHAEWAIFQRVCFHIFPNGAWRLTRVAELRNFRSVYNFFVQAVAFAFILSPLEVFFSKKSAENRENANVKRALCIESLLE